MSGPISGGLPALGEQWRDDLVQFLFGDLAKMGPDHLALLIQHHGIGQCASLVAQLAREIDGFQATDQECISDLEIFGKLSDFIGTIDGDADNLKTFRGLFFFNPKQSGDLFPAWFAPSCPEIHDLYPALPLLHGLRLAVRIG